MFWHMTIARHWQCLGSGSKTHRPYRPIGAATRHLWRQAMPALAERDFDFNIKWAPPSTNSPALLKTHEHDSTYSANLTHRSFSDIATKLAYVDVTAVVDGALPVIVALPDYVVCDMGVHCPLSPEDRASFKTRVFMRADMPPVGRATGDTP
jgi:hypothetical protein